MTEQQNIWQQFARPKYPLVSEVELEKLRLVAAVHWCDNEGDAQLITLYEKFITYKGLLK
jgi:hypothetical protein